MPYLSHAKKLGTLKKSWNHGLLLDQNRSSEAIVKGMLLWHTDSGCHSKPGLFDLIQRAGTVTSRWEWSCTDVDTVSLNSSLNSSGSAFWYSVINSRALLTGLEWEYSRAHTYLLRKAPYIRSNFYAVLIGPSNFTSDMSTHGKRR